MGVELHKLQSPVANGQPSGEHKPTVLGIPGQVPIPHQLECTVVPLQSLHALFQLLTSGGSLQHCPQAGFAVALGTATRP